MDEQLTQAVEDLLCPPATLECGSDAEANDRESNPRSEHQRECSSPHESDGRASSEKQTRHQHCDHGDVSRDDEEEVRENESDDNGLTRNASDDNALSRKGQESVDLKLDLSSTSETKRSYQKLTKLPAIAGTETSTKPAAHASILPALPRKRVGKKLHKRRSRIRSTDSHMPTDTDKSPKKYRRRLTPLKHSRKLSKDVKEASSMGSVPNQDGSERKQDLMEQSDGGELRTEQPERSSADRCPFSQGPKSTKARRKTTAGRRHSPRDVAQTAEEKRQSQSYSADTEVLGIASTIQQEITHTNSIVQHSTSQDQLRKRSCDVQDTEHGNTDNSYEKSIRSVTKTGKQSFLHEAQHDKTRTQVAAQQAGGLLAKRTQRPVSSTFPSQRVSALKSISSLRRTKSATVRFRGTTPVREVDIGSAKLQTDQEEEKDSKQSFTDLNEGTDLTAMPRSIKNSRAERVARPTRRRSGKRSEKGEQKDLSKQRRSLPRLSSLSPLGHTRSMNKNARTRSVNQDARTRSVNQNARTRRAQSLTKQLRPRAADLNNQAAGWRVSVNGGSKKDDTKTRRKTGARQSPPSRLPSHAQEPSTSVDQARDVGQAETVKQKAGGRRRKLGGKVGSGPAHKGEGRRRKTTKAVRLLLEGQEHETPPELETLVSDTAPEPTEDQTGEASQDTHDTPDVTPHPPSAAAAPTVTVSQETKRRRKTVKHSRMSLMSPHTPDRPRKSKKEKRKQSQALSSPKHSFGVGSDQDSAGKRRQRRSTHVGDAPAQEVLAPGSFGSIPEEAAAGFPGTWKSKSHDHSSHSGIALLVEPPSHSGSEVSTALSATEAEIAAKESNMWRLLRENLKANRDNNSRRALVSESQLSTKRSKSSLRGRKSSLRGSKSNLRGSVDWGAKAESSLEPGRIQKDRLQSKGGSIHLSGSIREMPTENVTHMVYISYQPAQTRDMLNKVRKWKKFGASTSPKLLVPSAQPTFDPKLRRETNQYTTCKQPEESVDDKDVHSYQIYSFVQSLVRKREQSESRRRWLKAMRFVCNVRRIAKTMAFRSYSLTTEQPTFMDIGDNALTDFHDTLHAFIDSRFFKVGGREGFNMNSEEVDTLLSNPQDRTPKQINLVLYNLQFIDAFCDFPLQTQRAMARLGYYQRIGSKRVIIREGHEPYYIYFILSGQAVVSSLVDTPEGSFRQTHATLTKGIMFGDMSIIKEGGRAATITSRTEMQLLLISTDDYINIFMPERLLDGIPEYIKYLSKCPWMKGWPVELLQSNPTKCYMRYFRHRHVVVADSTCSDNLYVIRNGKCQVLMLINSIKTSWKDLEKLVVKELAINDKHLDLADPFSSDKKSRKPRHRPLSASDIRTRSFIHPRDRSAYMYKLFRDKGRARSEPWITTPSGTLDSVSMLRTMRSLGQSKLESMSDHTEGFDPNSDSVHNVMCDEFQSMGYSALLSSTPGRSFGSHRMPKVPPSLLRTPAICGPSGDKPTPPTKRPQQPLSSWAKRQQYRVPSKCRPARKHDSVSTSISPKDPPVYVEIAALREGDVFGFDQLNLPLCIKPKSHIVSLVSSGAEMIVINKRFFAQHANAEVQQRVHRLTNCYPRPEEVHHACRMQMAWDMLQDKMKDEVDQRLDREHPFHGLYFQPCPSVNPLASVGLIPDTR